MDTECQRCGYDNTGRYHVPARKPCGPSENAAYYTTPDVESCSECGAVTDIEYPDPPANAQITEAINAVLCGRSDTFGAAQVCDSQSCAVETHVPFRVQEWMFESLAPSADLTIAELIEGDWNVILEMARDRFRRGYAKYGSNMYEWTARERLQNVLEELADAVVYMTSGPIT